MGWIKIAAWLGLLTVAIGAFGAHGLKDRLEEMKYTEQFRTGVLYQMFHVVGILAAGLLLKQGLESTWLRLAPWAFSGGILLFSGSLYVLSVTGVKWLGAITPVGGVLMMLGWLGIALGSEG